MNCHKFFAKPSLIIFTNAVFIMNKIFTLVFLFCTHLLSAQTFYTSTSPYFANTRAVVKAGPNDYWLASSTNGLTHYDNGIVTNYTTADGLANIALYAACLDESGNIWLASSGNVSVFNIASSSFTNIPVSISPGVRSIVYDSSGVVWAGTLPRVNGSSFDSSGLLKLDTASKSITQMITSFGGLSFPFVQSLAYKAGILYIGTAVVTSVSGGIVTYNGTTFTKYTTINGLPDNNIRDIALDSSGVWLGTNGGASYFNGTTFSNLNTGNGLCNNNLRSVTVDNSGNKWFGSGASGGGLSKYNSTTNTFTNYTQASGIGGAQIWDLLVDGSKLIIGTESQMSTYEDNCPPPATSVVDLEVNINPSSLQIMQGGTFYKYYKVQNGSGVNLPNVYVKFGITSVLGGTTTYVDAISDQNGHVTLKVDLGGSNNFSDADDLVGIGSYSINVVQIGGTSCAGTPAIPLASSYLDVTAFGPTELSAGAFVKVQALASACAGCISAQGYGFKGAELGLGAGLGFNLKVKDDSTNYMLDIGGEVKAIVEAKLGELSIPIGSDKIYGSVGSAELEYELGIKIKELPVNRQSLQDLAFAGFFMTAGLMPSKNTNVSLNVLNSLLNSYLKSISNPTWPPFKIETSDAAKIGLSAGPAIGLNNRLGRKADPKIQLKLFNVGGSAGLVVKRDREFSGLDKTYKRTMTFFDEFEYSLTNLEIRNFLKLGGLQTDIKRSADYQYSKTNDTFKTGKITYTHASITKNATVQGASLDVEQELSYSFEYGPNAIKMLRDSISQGKFQNFVGNYIAGNPVETSIFNCLVGIGNPNNAEQEFKNLNNYLANAQVPNGRDLSYKASRSCKFNSELEIDIKLDKSFGIGGKLETKAELGGFLAADYELGNGVFSSIKQDFVPSIQYPTNYYKVASPANIANNFITDFIDAVTLNSTDLYNAAVSAIYGFIEFLDATVGATIVSFFNTNKNTNNTARKVRGANLFTDFCRLGIEIGASGVSFDANTDLKYSHYFANGEVYGNIKGTSDTCMIVSDIFMLNAKLDTTILQVAPHGNFTINAIPHKNELKYFGLDTNSSVRLFHRGYTDTAWNILGTLQMDSVNQILFDSTGYFAFGIVMQLDTIPPTINTVMNATVNRADSLEFTIFDAQSGIKWDQLFCTINGLRVVPVRQGLATVLKLPLQSIDTTAGASNTIVISVSDLALNKSFADTVLLIPNFPLNTNNYLLQVTSSECIHKLSWQPIPSNQTVYVERRIGSDYYRTLAKINVEDLSFTDEQVNNSANYRLRIVDNNSKVRYSNTVVASCSSAKETFSLYPNPSAKNIAISSDNLKIKKIRINNALGNSVRLVEVNNSNETIIDISSLPNGLYYCTVADSRGITITQKFEVRH
jgi:hypothetical protein